MRIGPGKCTSTARLESGYNQFVVLAILNYPEWIVLSVRKSALTGQNPPNWGKKRWSGQKDVGSMQRFQMYVQVHRDESLPKLGWYAKIDMRNKTCEADVGRFVEVDSGNEPQWIVAGMWSGEFEKGDFHRAEHVFGSGLRLDQGCAVVVPAHSTVDRCVYARDGHVWHASNSLVVLLGRLGARINPKVSHRLWGESMCLGVHNYVRQFSVIHPRFSVMNQLIFEALRIDPDGQASFFFHDVLREFNGFSDYVGQFENALRSLWQNATSQSRKRPVRAVATASRGYDSGTVLAVLGSVIGKSLPCYCAPKSNTRVPPALQRLMKTNLSDDDGTEIALALGATPVALNTDYADLDEELESWCWATAQISPELVFHKLLSDADGEDVPTVFFGGHAGDGVWEKDLSPLMRSGQIIRGAQSGYALIEARNRCGVIECSAPYIFSRSVDSICRVSGSQEMAPWQLNNGYDRPICRRILEERGVRREAFGFGKKAVAHDMESPQGAALRQRFFSSSNWSPLTESVYRTVNLGLYFAGRSASFIEHRGDRAKIIWSGRPDAKRFLSRWFDLQRQTFVFVTNTLADRYALA
jgi:hypothetical protein